MQFCPGWLGAGLERIVCQSFPPSLKSEFKSVPFEELKRRNGWIYKSCYLISLLALCSPLGFYAAGISVHNPAPFALGFVLAGILPVALACGITLPSGLRRSHESWHYYEMRQEIRLRVALTFNLAVGAVGLLLAYVFF